MIRNLLFYDIENHFRKELNKQHKFPSFRKIFLVFLLFLLPLGVFAKVKKVHWQDLSWTLYINPHHYFMILGPWEGPLLVDHPVDNMWGRGGDLGLSIVYQKGIEFRWIILDRETGEKNFGGVLFYMGPDTGYVESIEMGTVQNGITVKVSFDTGDFTLYQIDSRGNKTVLKQGKSP